MVTLTDRLDMTIIVYRDVKRMKQTTTTIKKKLNKYFYVGSTVKSDSPPTGVQVKKKQSYLLSLG